MSEFNAALSFILVVGFLILLVIYIVVCVSAALYARRGYTLSQMISPEEYKEIKEVAEKMKEDRIISIRPLMSGKTSYQVLGKSGLVVLSVLYDPNKATLLIDHIDSSVSSGWKLISGRAVKSKEEFVKLIHAVEVY